MKEFLRIIVLAGVALAASLGAAGAETARELAGSLWQTEDGKFVVRIADDCESGDLCGDLVWLLEPIDRLTGELKLDRNNSDQALRDRPVCGLRIVQGLTERGANRWGGGRLYNPDDGGSYAAAMQLDPDNGIMSLRAYVGLRALGRTMRLHRLNQEVDSCI